MVPERAEGAALLDGAVIAAQVLAGVRARVEALAAAGRVPGLAAVLVGDDPASAVYVGAKERTCVELGMHGRTIRLPATTTEAELLAVVDRLNDDPAVHGILVQMPLPAPLDADTVIRRISPAKDVDGFHPVNVGKLSIGQPDTFVPCTPNGVMEMLRYASVPTKGAECVVVGRSNIVGKPMAALMLAADATVTICHSRSRDLPEHTRRADILIAAVGRPEMITGDMVKAGAVVVDVGINRVPDATRKSGSRLVGDVAFAGARARAALITPVPGGVGRMTIAMLMHNTVLAAERLA